MRIKRQHRLFWKDASNVAGKWERSGGGGGMLDQAKVPENVVINLTKRQNFEKRKWSITKEHNNELHSN